MSRSRVLLFTLGVCLVTVIAAAQTNLPKPSIATAPSVESSLNARRSIRAYEPVTISLREAGQLLWAAQGITAENGHRTAPSAGATYPLELYVVVQRVEGLEPGVYHYRPKGHLLERVAGPVDLAGGAIKGQKWIGDTSVVLVFTAVRSRIAAKYGDRADRYASIEAGAAAENAALEAVALNLGSCFVGGFDEAALRKILSLSEDEAPVILLPAGRPRR